MQLSLTDKYTIYRLIRKSDPYKPYVRGNGNWPGKQVHGICNLEFLFETGSVAEIFEQKPIVELFYMCGDKNVKAFVIDEEYTFHGLSVSSENRSVNYHAVGTAPIEGEFAFYYIYKTFDNEVVFITNEWNRAHMKEMHMQFQRLEKRQYGLWYDVKFINE